MTSGNTAIGLGSNKGDTCRSIEEAKRLLKEAGLEIVRCSSLYISDPVDCEPGTPDFVNAVLIGHWPGSVRQLLNSSKTIERTIGRPAQHSSRQARVIDLDILLFDNLVIEAGDIVLPHPQLQERLFVLKPFCEIAPDWIIPSTQKSIRTACNELVETKGKEQKVRKLTPKD